MFKNLFLPLMVLAFSQKSWELLIVNCELLIVKCYFEDKSEKNVCFQNKISPGTLWFLDLLRINIIIH